MEVYKIFKDSAESIIDLSLVAGDVVQIERGGKYSPTILTAKGTIESPITIESFGEGENPIFTGELILDNWVSEGSGKYSITNPLFNTISLLTIDGKTQPKGRFPKDKNLVIDAAFENQTLTNNNLKQTPNYRGAEIVVNKNSWVQDVGKITSHIGGTLSYEGTSDVFAKFGWSFFVQNHPSCLTSFGDWYFDESANKIVMYFGDFQPNLYEIKVANENIIFQLFQCEHLVFKGIDFAYGFESCVSLINSKDITFEGCNIQYSAMNGFYFDWQSHGCSINKCLISDTYNSSIDGDSVQALTVTNNTIINNFIHAGTGQNGHGKGSAIGVGYNNWQNGGYSIEDNLIENCGYNGINFSGSDVSVRRNTIKRACLVKEDGAAIYTFGIGGGANYLNRYVTDNKIFDCLPLGNPKGYKDGSGNLLNIPEVYGIYLDQDSQNIEIENNELINCDIPFFLNKSSNNKLRFNKVYNPTLMDKSIYQTGNIVEGNEFYLLEDYEKPEVPNVPTEPDQPEKPIENEVITLHFKSGVNYTINFRID